MLAMGGTSGRGKCVALVMVQQLGEVSCFLRRPRTLHRLLRKSSGGRWEARETINVTETQHANVHDFKRYACACGDLSMLGVNFGVRGASPAWIFLWLSEKPRSPHETAPPPLSLLVLSVVCSRTTRTSLFSRLSNGYLQVDLRRWSWRILHDMVGDKFLASFAFDSYFEALPAASPGNCSVPCTNYTSITDLVSLLSCLRHVLELLLAPPGRSVRSRIHTRPCPVGEDSRGRIKCK